jgi:hypothetical protein
MYPRFGLTVLANLALLSAVSPGTKGFFNILVERKGIREGKPFSERELFKFNGQKYVPSQL